MNTRNTLIALCIATALAPAARADDIFSLSGFGTFGLVHSTEDHADFVPDFQSSKGVGASNATSARPDSRLAAQVNARFSDDFSAVLQMTSEYAERGSYTPKVTLAHVKYVFSPAFSTRIGRITAPLYMLSEYQRVGYATPWVRPPYEVYNYLLPMDGIEGNYTFNAGNNAVSVTGYYGRIDSKKASVHAMRGLAVQLDNGASTLRAAYFKGSADYSDANTDKLFALYRRINPALAGELQPYGMKGSFASVGYLYDPGNWFLRTEITQADYSPSINGKTTAGYLSAGIRLGAWTPSFTFANVDRDNTRIAPGADPIGLMSKALASTESGRHSYTASLRWDVHESIAVKLQASHVDNNAGSFGSLSNIQPGFRPGGSYNLVSASVDFVF